MFRNYLISWSTGADMRKPPKVNPTIVVPNLEFVKKTHVSDCIGLNKWEERGVCSPCKYICDTGRET